MNPFLRTETTEADMRNPFTIKPARPVDPIRPREFDWTMLSFDEQTSVQAYDHGTVEWKALTESAQTFVRRHGVKR